MRLRDSRQGYFAFSCVFISKDYDENIITNSPAIHYVTSVYKQYCVEQRPSGRLLKARKRANACIVRLCQRPDRQNDADTTTQTFIAGNDAENYGALAWSEPMLC